MRSDYIGLHLLFCVLWHPFSAVVTAGVDRNLPKWIRKCCPDGEVIANEGKGCVKVNSNDIGVLTELLDNVTTDYTLSYTSPFLCGRPEGCAVGKDTIRVTDDNVAVVYDNVGLNWTLTTSELCVDVIGLTPRIIIALMCPSCQDAQCLHKCCPEFDRLQVNTDATQVSCVPSSELSWGLLSQTSTSERAYVFHGFPECSHSMYLQYYSGPIALGPDDELLLRQQLSLPRAEYCVDYTGTGDSGDFALLACRQAPATSFKPKLYGTLMCVGAVFLALTLGLHLWLPELRTSLHSRVLLAHIFCSLVAFLGLALANLAPLPAPSLVCSTTAFSIQFSFLAAMFWLNVMCVDIAWTFSGVRVPRTSLTLDSDGHKYLYYSMYAWGTSVAICALTAVFEYSSVLPLTSRLKPGFGIISCWFRYRESILILLYGPMGLLLLSNVGLFVYTAIKIQRTQRDTASIVQHAGSKLRQDRNRFSLYLKLFCLMGVTWLFEVVSWVVEGSDAYWYVTDVFNALRGVFIFLLFCLKKNVINLIKSKFKKAPQFPRYPRKSTSSKTSSSMSSQRTSSFQLSHIS